MNMLSWAGITLFLFLASSCFSSSASPCAAAAVSFLLLSLIFISYLPKRKLTNHLKLVHNEDAECHAQERPQGLGSIGEEQRAAAAAAAQDPNWCGPAIDEDAGLNQDKDETTPDRTSEMSIDGSNSEDWGSLSLYSSVEDEEDADGLIEISLPFHEGDHTGLYEQFGHKEDDVLNDDEEDILIELDISEGFIKTSENPDGESEQ